MINNTYSFKLFTPDGRFIQTLDNFISAEFGRKKNEAGACNILLPGELYDYNIFKEDCILEIWRYDRFGRISLVGDTAWFLRKITFSLNENNFSSIELVFFDTIELLRRRVNAWFLYDRDLGGIGWDRVFNYPSNLYENAHDILIDLFTHNFEFFTQDTRFGAFDPLPGNRPAGILPAQDRSWTDLGDRFPVTAEALLLGTATSPTLLHASAWENVRDSMKKVCDSSIAAGTNLWFDIEYYPNTGNTIGTFQFKGYENVRGTDRRIGVNSFLLSPEFGNLINVKLDLDYTESVNAVYGITEDEAFLIPPLKGVLVQEVHTLDYLDLPFYPIESVVQVSQNNVSGGITPGPDETNPALDPGLALQIGQEELYNKKRKEILVADILQTPTSSFFHDYKYGDMVRVEAFGFVFEAEIDSFLVSIDSDGFESIKIPLNAQLFTKDINLVNIV